VAVLLDLVTSTVSDGAAALKVLLRTGLVSPVRPDRFIGMTRSFVKWGSSPAAAYAMGAIRSGLW
jgi:hypothetical protein